MPAYDICYIDDDGELGCAFTVQFETEMRAKILAHAMKPPEYHRIEVWTGRTLVYRRPEQAGGLDARRPVAHMRENEPGYFASPA